MDFGGFQMKKFSIFKRFFLVLLAGLSLQALASQGGSSFEEKISEVVETKGPQIVARISSELLENDEIRESIRSGAVRGARDALLDKIVCPAVGTVLGTVGGYAACCVWNVFAQKTGLPCIKNEGWLMGSGAALGLFSGYGIAKFCREKKMKSSKSN